MLNNENNNLENNIPNIGVKPIPTTALQTELEIPQVSNNITQVTTEPEISTQQPINSKENNSTSAGMIPLALVNAIVIFSMFYLTVNKNSYFIIGAIGYVLLGSIIFAIIEKQKSEFPTTILIGGIMSAVICFVVSMLHEEEMDLWTYYSIACALTGFIGLISSNIITRIMTDLKNIKALQTLGYILFFALIFGGSYLAYQKWPTEFNQFVLFKKNEVIAETYEEYVIKTLKARYNVDFTCNFDKQSLHKTERNELMKTLSCQTPAIDTTINLKIIPYSESKVQYTIIDDFLEKKYLKTIKDNISKKIKQVTEADIVTTYLYPKNTCMFTGDCADCEDYYKDYSKINDSKERYEVSSSINLSKYTNLSLEEFITKYINENEYKIILNIKGNYSKNYTDFPTLEKKILEELTKLNLKNTYGYEINFFNTSVSSLETKVHNIVGKTNDTKEFK